MAMNRPNFVFIIPDQWRFDWLGCRDNLILQTPNLDRLAAEGIRFDRCYTNHPMCMAARATWFTGMTPRAHGVRCNGIPLRTDIPTIPQVLADAGYRTHAIGKIHLSPWFPQNDFNIDTLEPSQWPEAMPLWHNERIRQLPTPYYGLQSVDFLGGNGQHGYGDYFNWLLEKEPDARKLLSPPPGVEMNFERSVEIAWESQLPEHLHKTTWAVECAERFFANRCPNTPFFLWLSIPDPHPPYSAPPPWSRMYKPEDMPAPNRREGELDDLPPHYKQLFETGLKTAGRIAPTNIDLQRHREVMAMAYGMAGKFDKMVGRILDILKTHNVLDETVICFTSDHGQMMGDHWMYSMPPSHLDGNVRVPSIWRFPKLFPPGRVSQSLVSHLDLAPTILDLADLPIPEGFAPPVPEASNQGPAWPGRSIMPLLTDQAKNVQDSVIVEFDSDYTGLRLRTLITQRYHITIYVNREYGEFYDLEEDPKQLYNLWNSPRHERLKQQLLLQLLHRVAETDSHLPRRLGHA